MSLKVQKESIFCLDFTREKLGDFIPYEITIPELIYRKSQSNRMAVVFDSEKVSLTCQQIKNEIEQLAAGLISTGLQLNDRVLICGYNHSHVLISTLAVARAGMVFSLANPNFNRADQLRHLLEMGQFRAVILCSPIRDSDQLYNYMLEFCPELKTSAKGQLHSKSLPQLSHVILADEDHMHAGTFTLSEIFGKSTKERIEKLPPYQNWNSHRMAAIQFTMGSTARPKAIGLTHYQLINGCRIALNAIGIKKETVLSCALPMFRIPVFCLVAFTPFLVEAQTVFPEPSPLPKYLFKSIEKYKCTTLLSNAAALRLLLKVAQSQKIRLLTVNTVILLGERVSAELLTSINSVMENARRIAVGMLLTETGAVPILSDNTTDLGKAVGRPLDGYEMELSEVEKISSKNRQVGELRVRPLAATKFIGYGPHFNSFSEWINTGDVVAQTSDGNIEIISHKDDLIYNRNDELVEHWKMEKIMSQHKDVKGVQVLQICHGAPVVAIVVPKSLKCVPEFLKTDLTILCRNNKLHIPEKFAITDDFPRVNTRIQKYILREMLRKGALVTY
uniref:AMP-dependent synthetase/ligase domain-containing protein n=1 Tax=Acrobeloides nanus TaxID=290746 RepID=A0A914C6Y4_9BILA